MLGSFVRNAFISILILIHVVLCPLWRLGLQELEERFSAGLSPFPKAESFSVHELIDPRETRARLCDWVDLVQPLLPGLLGKASLRYTP